jgi:hypothetical protein
MPNISTEELLECLLLARKNSPTPPFSCGHLLLNTCNNSCKDFTICELTTRIDARIKHLQAKGDSNVQKV